MGCLIGVVAVAAAVRLCVSCCHRQLCARTACHTSMVLTSTAPHRWWQATFKVLPGDNNVQIHFVGFPDSNDEIVTGAIGKISARASVCCLFKL